MLKFRRFLPFKAINIGMKRQARKWQTYLSCIYLTKDYPYEHLQVNKK